MQFCVVTIAYIICRYTHIYTYIYIERESAPHTISTPFTVYINDLDLDLNQPLYIPLYIPVDKGGGLGEVRVRHKATVRCIVSLHHSQSI